MQGGKVLSNLCHFLVGRLHYTQTLYELVAIIKPALKKANNGELVIIITLDFKSKFHSFCLHVVQHRTQSVLLVMTATFY